MQARECGVVSRVSIHLLIPSSFKACCSRASQFVLFLGSYIPLDDRPIDLRRSTRACSTRTMGMCIYRFIKLMVRFSFPSWLQLGFLPVSQHISSPVPFLVHTLPQLPPSPVITRYPPPFSTASSAPYSTLSSTNSFHRSLWPPPLERQD